MKTPQVNYREFRLSKLNEPQFSHLKLLSGWLVYFALYFITERLIPVENCFVVHSRLDDLIPFCEWFVIPYVGWYLLIVWSLWYFALYNTDGFRRLQTFIIITQLVAMAVYILFPNMQDLRPAVFPRDNVLTRLVGVLYTADTNTNVFPSLHVAYSIGIASVWLKEKTANWKTKTFVVIFVVLVCLSTAFIKQHSVLDGFAALLLCFGAELMVYGKDYWLPKLKRVRSYVERS